MDHSTTRDIIPTGKTYSTIRDNHFQKDVADDVADDVATPVHSRLTRTVCAAIHGYYAYIDDFQKPQWNRIIQMLQGYGWYRSEEYLSLLRGLKPGGTLSGSLSESFSESILDSCIFHFPYYETAAIFTKQDCCTLYELFELHPFDEEGALEVIHSYPDLIIEIPNEVFHDKQFQCELADFLDSINSRSFDSHTDWNKGAESIFASRYTTQLLSGILRTVGRLAEVPHVSKHVVRPVHRSGNTQARSNEWFLLKLVIQTTLDRSLPGGVAYKTFMLFFVVNLAKYAINKFNTSLSSNLLHLMSVKILRRFRKLGASVPKWLSDAVMLTCTRISDILDDRCIQAQIAQRTSPPWNLSQLDLTQDIQLSLSRCSKHLSGSLTHSGPNSSNAPVLHSPIRGNLHDFLSLNCMFFEEAYLQDPFVALYDVEKAVEQEVDNWNACIGDVDEACIQLEVLVGKYLSGLQCISGGSVKWSEEPPYSLDHFSIALLTTIELWVALDKLVVKKIPILAGYSPEILMDLFDKLLLHKTTNLHHFIQAHQYISARHAE